MSVSSSRRAFRFCSTKTMMLASPVFLPRADLLAMSTPTTPGRVRSSSTTDSLTGRMAVDAFLLPLEHWNPLMRLHRHISPHHTLLRNVRNGQVRILADMRPRAAGQVFQH